MHLFVEGAALSPPASRCWYCSISRGTQHTAFSPYCQSNSRAFFNFYHAFFNGRYAPPYCGGMSPPQSRYGSAGISLSAARRIMLLLANFAEIINLFCIFSAKFAKIEFSSCGLVVKNILRTKYLIRGHRK